MKILVTPEYSHLLNNNSKPVYCIRRTPNFIPTQGKLGGMELITAEGPIHFCGDHCPFFKLTLTEVADDAYLATVEIRCGNIENEIPIHYCEVVKPEKESILKKL